MNMLRVSNRPVVPKNTQSFTPNNREKLEIGNCLIAKDFLHQTKITKPLAFFGFVASLTSLTYPMAEAAASLIDAPATSSLDPALSLCISMVSLPFTLLMISIPTLWLPLETIMTRQKLSITPEIGNSMPNLQEDEKISANISGPLFHFAISSAISYVMFSQIAPFVISIFQVDHHDPETILKRMALFGSAWVVNCFSFFKLYSASCRLKETFMDRIEDFIEARQGSEIAQAMAETNYRSLGKIEQLADRIKTN